jgi:hypothetical protein
MTAVAPRFVEILESLQIIVLLHPVFDPKIGQCFHHLAHTRPGKFGSFAKRSAAQSTAFLLVDLGFAQTVEQCEHQYRHYRVYRRREQQTQREPRLGLGEQQAPRQGDDPLVHHEEEHSEGKTRSGVFSVKPCADR